VVKTRRSEERVRTALPTNLGGATGTTRDISASGIFVETDVHYPLGEPVTFSVEFDNPGGKLMLKGQGDVVRIERRETKVGVALKITQSTIEPVQ
jgi:Tfp pilus assembly protein PilZ